MVRAAAVPVFALLSALANFLLSGCSGSSSGPHAPVTYLDQGWDKSTRQTFYYTSQGAVIMPASWLAALNSPDFRPLMSPERMRRLGFIYDDTPSSANPYHWPVGFAIDTSTRIPTVGITCAACHTGQITYRGTTMRIDGGQANVDIDAFKRAVAAALLTTGASPLRRAAFERRAVQQGYPRDRMSADFDAAYGALLRQIPEQLRTAATTTQAGPGRLDALATIAHVLFSDDLDVPGNTNRATGPVDYPYLWSIWHFDWVEYNGSARPPMGRNIGEALGTGVVTHLVDPATGALTPLPGRWRTSIRVFNIYAMEQIVAALQPPRWPQAVFGSIDQAQAARGRQLFAQNCAACHAVAVIENSPDHEWAVKVIPLSVIGTDPMQANNFRYTRYDASKLGISKPISGAEGLELFVGSVEQQAYRDAGIPPSQWPLYNGWGRSGPVTAPCGYKARPLVGVWATPPFLHNGSVPSIFDLLSETRPARFQIGGTEYDPRHLGFVEATGPGTMTLDTSLVGNSNAGHWFTNDRRRPGRIGRHLSDAEKYAIIEYLKIASYADYPRVNVPGSFPEPCVAKR